VGQLFLPDARRSTPNIPRVRGSRCAVCISDVQHRPSSRRGGRKLSRGTALPCEFRLDGISEPIGLFRFRCRSACRRRPRRRRTDGLARTRSKLVQAFAGRRVSEGTRPSSRRRACLIGLRKLLTAGPRRQGREPQFKDQAGARRAPRQTSPPALAPACSHCKMNA
jgi:hypothetical protein